MSDEGTGIQDVATGAATEQADNAEPQEVVEGNESTVEQTPEQKAEAEQQAVEQDKVKKQNHRDRRIEGVFHQNAALRGQISALQQQVEKLAGAMTAKAEATDPKPDPAKFNDAASYVAASNEWMVRETARQVDAAISKRMPQQGGANTDWIGKATAFKASNPDYDQAIAQADQEGVQIPNFVSEIIKQVSDGPAILYHIAKNPDVANELMGMNNADAILHLGTIRAEIRASATKKPVVSRAAPPIKPPKGTGDKVSKSVDEMSSSEFAAYRNAQEKKLHPERFRR